MAGGASLNGPSKILDELEANHRARLYKARWDELTAGEVVPLLIRLLQGTDRVTLLRSFRALVTIGPLARDALTASLPHLGSDDPDICDAAAIAVGCIALRDPESAVRPLVEAFRPGREKAILNALLGFGAASGQAAPVFVQAFEHKSAAIRRLALRGLKAIEAPAATINAVLTRAESDRSREVREYALKLFGNQGRA